MKRIVIAAALAAAAVAIPATPASATHYFCTHMGLVEFVKCTVHPVTDLLREGSS